MHSAFQSGVKGIFLLLLCAPAWASFSTEGRGRLSVYGSIVDSACAIETGSREQDVEIGGLTVEELMRSGHGPTQPFSISLVNCVLERAGRPNWETFSITFDGLRDGNNFGARGTASGVALRITDAEGRQIVPGRAHPKKNISPGRMTLDYAVTPVAGSGPLKPGSYFSLIKFRLDYF